MLDPRTEVALLARPSATKTTPAWWTSEHTSNWERVKGALERDWEQTKADFSEGSGLKLNQNIADTVSQSMGSTALPPLSVMTRPTDPIAAREEVDAAAAESVGKAQDHIRREHGDLGKPVADLRPDSASQPVKSRDQMVDAFTNEKVKQQNAEADDIAMERLKIDQADQRRSEVMATWRDAESGIRYGYSVHSQYSSTPEWDAALERRLKDEWEVLNFGTPWHVSRPAIRLGWNYAVNKA